MSVEVMLDVETLGRKPGCVVLSIGAVQFDPMAGQLLADGVFYAAINPRYAQNIGLTIDADTVKWWLDQDEHVRNAAFSGKESCHETLAGLVRYLQYVEYVWSHGASFDIPILEAVFDRCGIEVPWTHHQIQDTRTVFRPLSIDYRAYYGVSELRHHPINDARACARAVMAAYKQLGLAPNSRVDENDGTRPIIDRGTNEYR